MPYYTNLVSNPINLRAGDMAQKETGKQRRAVRVEVTIHERNASFNKQHATSARTRGPSRRFVEARSVPPDPNANEVAPQQSARLAQEIPL